MKKKLTAIFLCVALAAIAIVGNHHTDTDISIICAGVDHIGALGKVAAGNHVFAAFADIFGVFLGVCLDLFIGEHGVTRGDIFHAIISGHLMGGIGDGGIAGVVVAFAVVSGLDQVDLDITDGEGIRCALGIGEVRKRCAHDGDRRESNAQENRSQFLFHVCLLPFMYLFFCARAQGETY